MAKENTLKLTFIAQGEIQVQEVFSKEKEKEGILMTFQNKRTRKTTLTFEIQAVQGSKPKSKLRS